MPTKDEAYKCWAPPEALWSRWVKPVLFAFADGVFEESPARILPLAIDWAPATPSSALVLDFPQEDGVLCAIQLAGLGYRPVPLYNALPFPVSEQGSDPSLRSKAAVEVEPILSALVNNAEALGRANLKPDSPPAFLLDANRRLAHRELRPGLFDNRSVCFITDFPSAEFLLNHGITNIVVATAASNFADDLREVLISWQRGGLQILHKNINNDAKPTPVVVKPPSFLANLWFRLSVGLGLKKAEIGGFGRILSTGSG